MLPIFSNPETTPIPEASASLARAWRESLSTLASHGQGFRVSVPEDDRTIYTAHMLNSVLGLATARKVAAALGFRLMSRTQPDMRSIRVWRLDTGDMGGELNAHD